MMPWIFLIPIVEEQARYYVAAIGFIQYNVICLSSRWEIAQLLLLNTCIQISQWIYLKLCIHISSR